MTTAIQQESKAEIDRRNLRAGNEKRLRAAAERRALVGAPRSVVEPALREPTDALGSSRLSTLFVGSGRRKGLIPRFGINALQRAFDRVESKRPCGRKWHGELRLDELLDVERNLFVSAVIEQAPKWWREEGE